MRVVYAFVCVLLDSAKPFTESMGGAMEVLCEL